MATREQMLAAVRKALRRETPTNAGSATYRPPSLPELGRVLPPVNPAALVEKFESELQKVAGAAYRAGSAAQLDEILQEILSKFEAGTVVLSRNPLLAQLKLPEKLSQWGKPFTVWSRENSAGAAAPADFRAHCFAAKIGFTGVEFALAESGTLVLTSLTEGSQLVSLAPPVHVALYRRAQVVETLEEVLTKLPGFHHADQPSPGRSAVFITGPSRTADIEQISIRGVHGPTHVCAVLVEDSCFP